MEEASTLCVAVKMRFYTGDNFRGVENLKAFSFFSTQQINVLLGDVVCSSWPLFSRESGGMNAVSRRGTSSKNRGFGCGGSARPGMTCQISLHSTSSMERGGSGKQFSAVPAPPSHMPGPAFKSKRRHLLSEEEGEEEEKGLLWANGI